MASEKTAMPAYGTISAAYWILVFTKFANTLDQPIKRVVFALSDETGIADVGTFTSGVTIDHTIDLDATQADSCHVVSATLADGERWKTPQTIAAGNEQRAFDESALFIQSLRAQRSK